MNQEGVLRVRVTAADGEFLYDALSIDKVGVGYVIRFEVDGGGFSVYVPGFEGQSEQGEPLAFTDFAQLIVTSPTPPSTGTTTTTTVSVPTSEPQSGDDGQ